MMVRTAGASILVVCIGCGSPRAISTEPAVSTPDKLVLHPAIKPGDSFGFHVTVDIDSTVTAGTTPQHAHAIIALDDRADVTGASELRETFANVTASGEGQLGDALRRVATALPSASATTRFDASWQVISTSIDGTQDDEARTLIVNLAPVIAFRLLPKGPVAVGESWTNERNEALRSAHGVGTGNVATNVRYTLREFTTCAGRRCAAIVGDGKDTFPPQCYEARPMMGFEAA